MELVGCDPEAAALPALTVAVPEDAFGKVGAGLVDGDAIVARAPTSHRVPLVSVTTSSVQLVSLEAYTRARKQEKRKL